MISKRMSPDMFIDISPSMEGTMVRVKCFTVSHFDPLTKKMYLIFVEENRTSTPRFAPKWRVPQNRSKEQTSMTEQQVSPLITFYKHGWENYQQAVVQTIALLSPEQLSLPVAPHYVSIGELLAHMIDGR